MGFRMSKELPRVGYVVNFMLGAQSYPRYVILKFPGIDDEAAASKLIGRKVIWKTSTGKEITGKIVKTHGTAGCVVAVFKKALPGQALGTHVYLKN